MSVEGVFIGQIEEWANQSLPRTRGFAEKYPEMWAIFHRLWSRDVDSPSYNRREWLDLEAAIIAALVQQKKEGAS